jgi:hypothetical protein
MRAESFGTKRGPVSGRLEAAGVPVVQPTSPTDRETVQIIRRILNLLSTRDYGSANPHPLK